MLVLVIRVMFFFGWRLFVLFFLLLEGFVFVVLFVVLVLFVWCYVCWGVILYFVLWSLDFFLCCCSGCLVIFWVGLYVLCFGWWCGLELVLVVVEFGVCVIW